MSVLDIFWIFFMLSALQPVIRQRMLDAMRMRKIAQLEREELSRHPARAPSRNDAFSWVSGHAVHRCKRL
jgi:hypothetical protein